LPPAASNPEDACVDSLRRALRAAKAELAEAKRQERVRSESLLPGPYQVPLEIRPSPAPVAPAPAPATSDSDSDSARPESVQQAKNRFLTKLFGYGTIVIIPFGGWLVSVLTAWETRAKTDRSEVKSENAQVTASSAFAEVGEWKTLTVKLQEELRKERANNREYFRLGCGVEIPKAEGDEAPDAFEVTRPICPPGKVCPGLQVVRRKAP